MVSKHVTFAVVTVEQKLAKTIDTCWYLRAVGCTDHQDLSLSLSCTIHHHNFWKENSLVVRHNQWQSSMEALFQTALDHNPKINKHFVYFLLIQLSNIFTACKYCQTNTNKY